VGRHQFGALTSLFSFLGLWKGAVGGKPAIGSASGLATNEGPVLAGVAVAEAESTGVSAGVAVGVALSASSGGGGDDRGKGDDDIARGPGGARKHNPGKGHRNPTNERKQKERFQKKAADKRATAEADFAAAEERWKGMTEQAQKLRPDLNPANFKR